MAKIDIATIEGYESMTPEQKVAALEGFDIPDYAAELERHKRATDKATHEAAEYKRKYNEKLTEEERKAEEAATREREMQERLAEYEKRDKLSSLSKKYIAMGYDETIANENAEAYLNGDMDKVFENHKKFMENRDKALKAQLLKQRGSDPQDGNPDGGSMTKEKFLKMSYQEQMKYKEENPDWRNLA